MENNAVILVGKIVTSPTLMEIKNRSYCSFNLEVRRSSGVPDTIPIICSINKLHLQLGDRVEVSIGEYRSYNIPNGGRMKLLLTVFAKEVHKLYTNMPDTNNIELSGYVCKEPVYRKTPKNRTICEILLAVNTRSGWSVYIPCIIWGELANECKDLPVGDKIGIQGRVQSREYEKRINEDSVETRVAWEISVGKVEFYSGNNRDKGDA
jgi:single-stranded DNA-binding protein